MNKKATYTVGVTEEKSQTDFVSLEAQSYAEADDKFWALWCSFRDTGNVEIVKNKLRMFHVYDRHGNKTFTVWMKYMNRIVF